MVTKETSNNEIGAIKKEWGGRTSIALVYPNTYHVGMSNLALHQLYKLFNLDPRIVAERVFLPLTEGEPVLSEESRRPVSDFSILAFTFSFEADYLNISRILGKSVALLRKNRDENSPILIAGGPSPTLNPRVLYNIFDAIVVGEAEPIINELTKIIKEPINKEEKLKRVSKLQGIFVPGINSNTNRIYATNLDAYPTHSVLWTENTEFGHMHLVEVSRGCPWRCCFCATPSIYKPYRFRNKKIIQESIEYGLPHKKHVGLIGSDIAGLPNFIEIANELIEQNIKLSLSSIRANRVDKDLSTVLAKSGHKRITLGIEAGAERLRKLLDKDLSDSKIFSAVKNLASAGITNLKLYFMLGLPNETEEDIKGIASLTREIRNIILKDRKLKTLSPNISIVATPFVPKKETPFTNRPFAGEDYLHSALKHLKSLAGKIPNTKISSESPKKAYIEYLLSNGDKETIQQIMETSQK